MTESKKIMNELSVETWVQTDKDTRESIMESLDTELTQSFIYELHLSFLRDLLDAEDNICLDKFNVYQHTDHLGIYHKLKFDPSILSWIYEYSVILLKE